MGEREQEVASISEADIVIERDVVSRENTPVPTPELRGKGLYDLSNSENMNNQNN
jgi:hypothetical protein